MRELIRSLWWLSMAAVCAGCGCGAVSAGETWYFSCPPENDLFQVMSGRGFTVQRYDTAGEAIEHAPPGGAVLILADRYPAAKMPMKTEWWNQARAKKLRLYVEYPDTIPGKTIGADRAMRWERTVVREDGFGPALPPLSLLSIQDGRYFEVEADPPGPVLAAARVAGYDRAVFGLPEKRSPILFRHPDFNQAWIATTQLSRFVTARYSPYAAWQAVWQAILSDLAGREVPPLTWELPVRPMYARKQEFPPDGEFNAMRRGIEWFVHSRLLVHPTDEENIEAHLRQGYAPSQPYAAGWMSSEARRLPPPDAPLGDGTHGFLEGYSSRILSDGSQLQRIIRRSDCMAEAAMGLAFGEGLDPGSSIPYAAYAKNLLDYVYFHSAAQQGVRADPKHPAYGLIAWGVTNREWERATYGDDMARVMLATLAAAGLTGADRWDEGLLKCLLASLRTTGKLGFRHDRIDIPELEKNGWRYYFEEPHTSYAPHYQAYLWACYLWAYHQTGFQPFLDKAKSAIRLTLEAYPDQWRWTNGIQQERARMLLPLSWLVRVEDTPEHRAWLRKMADDLLALQDASGAIREAMGALAMGTIRPPHSNEEYGTSETPVIQNNGDPASDLLYTTNFAFLGLHEAAAATGEEFYQKAADRLAEFLCRIQICSEVHPVLDGGWFRAFDFQKWEYWGSNGDAGWGAWCIESGWTQGWITAVLGLRHKNTSLWDLGEPSTIERHFAKLLPAFFPRKERSSLNQSETPKPQSPALTVIPPSPVTDKITLDLRGAVRNIEDVTQAVQWSISIISPNRTQEIQSGEMTIPPQAWQGVRVRWPARGHGGMNTIVFSVSDEIQTATAACAVEIIPSPDRSTRQIDGAWLEFYHWSEAEGKLWNPEIRKLTDDQWQEQVRGMHDLGMNIIVIEETFRNQFYYCKHDIPQSGYQGKAYYPSRLYPGRMEIAARDPVEAALAQADALNMQAFMGVGLYAWFDFTPESLQWHKEVASELWERYGHHPSFYGWYIAEETPGMLHVYGEDTPEQIARYQQEIVAFFQGFREHVHRFAPHKPIMLAPNCHFMKQAEAAWRQLAKYCDIIIPFGFHRMPPGDVTGEEVAAWFQQLCDDSGAHLWMDMEVFLFGPEGELYPRPIEGLLSDLLRFPTFEKILCYQYPGLLNAPGASIQPGGEATVKLFTDYQRYYRTRRKD